MRNVFRYNNLWGYVNEQMVKSRENDADWISKIEKALDLIERTIEPIQSREARKYICRNIGSIQRGMSLKVP